VQQLPLRLILKPETKLLHSRHHSAAGPHSPLPSTLPVGLTDHFCVHQLERLVATLDCDSDGNISYEELEGWMAESS